MLRKPMRTQKAWWMTMPSLGQMKYTWAFSGAGERASTGTDCRSAAVSIKTVIFRIPAASCKRGLWPLWQDKGVAGTIAAAGGLNVS
jgi:hypothetical protein